MISVEVDKGGGFCGGVIRAIGCAEEYLRSRSDHLYSLGSIVHNESELERLSSLGLVPLDEEDLDLMSCAKGESILIRAHGQPPETYEKLRRLGFEIIDCTCPVVLGIQRKIARAKGEVIIYGRHGHPEVLGLVGQSKGRVRVVEDMNQVSDMLENDAPGEGAEIFAQTTASPIVYEEICRVLRERIPGLKVHHTICAQVATRHRNLEEFARNHDVIIFVSGKVSSNGRVLCNLCKSVNIRTYRVGSVAEINPAWFRPDDRVGVSGATSTPRWLLDEVAGVIAGM